MLWPGDDWSGDDWPEEDWLEEDWRSLDWVSTDEFLRFGKTCKVPLRNPFVETLATPLSPSFGMLLAETWQVRLYG